MSLSLPKCCLCNHYYYDEKDKKMCCDAFPKGIPLLEIDENREAECKNGIKFKRKNLYGKLNCNNVGNADSF